MKSGNFVAVASRRSTLWPTLVVVVSLVGSLGCIWLATGQDSAGRSAPTLSTKPDTAAVAETGLASYYGVRYHGKRTASGEIFDMEKLTAAHRTLPFGTTIKVTRLDNGRSVILKVNDRGPFVEGRIIDVSLAAARELQMVAPGLAKISIAILK